LGNVWTTITSLAETLFVYELLTTETLCCVRIIILIGKTAFLVFLFLCGLCNMSVMYEKATSVCLSNYESIENLK